MDCRPPAAERPVCSRWTSSSFLHSLSHPGNCGSWHAGTKICAATGYCRADYCRPCVDDWCLPILGCMEPDRVYYCRRSEEHTSELQSQSNLVCRLLLEKKNIKKHNLY